MSWHEDVNTRTSKRDAKEQDSHQMGFLKDSRKFYTFEFYQDRNSHKLLLRIICLTSQFRVSAVAYDSETQIGIAQDDLDFEIDVAVPLATNFVAACCPKDFCVP